MASSSCFARRCTRWVRLEVHVVAHRDGIIVFLQACGSLLQMLIEESLVVLQVLIFGGFLRCFQLVRHRLC